MKCMKKAMLWLVSTVLGTATLLAQPPLVVIQDVLYRADGTLYTGYLEIEWKSFEASDNSTIATQSLNLKIYKGQFKTQLVPTTTATPASAYYRVRYVSDGKLQALETWVVPATTAILKVKDVRVPNGDGSAPSAGAATTLQISDVSGLTEALAARPQIGAGYASNRAAVINSFGQIEGALGGDSDCVSVAGLSQACSATSLGASFVDGETPAGTLDGSNAIFTITRSPSPSASLSVYRNGVLQVAGADFSASGATVTFNSGSIPQAGDILIASYRIAGVTGPAPQVLCIGNGLTTSATASTSLGTCTIAGGVLAPNDRVEILADYARTGNTGFQTEIRWGSTSTVSSAGGTTDAGIALRESVSVANGSGATGWSGQRWGSATALTGQLGSATADYTQPLTVEFRGNMSASTSDTVRLRNYAVIRYPAP
jgi:hypothetical protein